MSAQARRSVLIPRVTQDLKTLPATTHAVKHPMRRNSPFKSLTRRKREGMMVVEEEKQEKKMRNGKYIAISGKKGI
ncbi:hypothetical protein E2C01_101429 [Portunus trituberculatus]|uniref:Uncharacterized protein n=1 Tax=Portunus trituberculatus TaxID=210409 RepID=A0A5B7K9K6_PORTR|nr:hypothetical protein [Portunus trituberculatus]